MQQHGRTTRSTTATGLGGGGPKPKPKPVAPAQAPVVVVAGSRPSVDPVTFFDITRETVEAYARNAAHDIRSQLPSRALYHWDHRPPKHQRGSLFLQRTADRYVVISIDPAGGGALSDEVFVVFLVADDQFGLLTARVIPGHNTKYGFSLVPLVFVLSLLRTVREVRQLLRDAHDAAGLPAADFRMPPVVVVIENNFAYGAATYMQLLWFLRERQRRSASADLANVEIIFATPVYGLNAPLPPPWSWGWGHPPSTSPISTPS